MRFRNNFPQLAVRTEAKKSMLGGKKKMLRRIWLHTIKCKLGRIPLSIHQNNFFLSSLGFLSVRNYLLGHTSHSFVILRNLARNSRLRQMPFQLDKWAGLECATAQMMRVVVDARLR